MSSLSLLTVRLHTMEMSHPEFSINSSATIGGLRNAVRDDASIEGNPLEGAKLFKHNSDGNTDPIGGNRKLIDFKSPEESPEESPVVKFQI